MFTSCTHEPSYASAFETVQIVDVFILVFHMHLFLYSLLVDLSVHFVGGYQGIKGFSFTPKISTQ